MPSWGTSARAVMHPDVGDPARAEPDDGGRRQPPGLLGLLQELHARLLRRATALLRIAALARRDDVLPYRTAPLHTRQDVVVRELARVLVDAAVLAAEVVTHEH